MSTGCGLTTAQLHRLDLAVQPLRKMTAALDGPCGIYLVGTVNSGGPYRDVDVRMILADDDFDELFGDKPELWEAFSYAVSRWLAADTDLPIDFQVQRMTEANKLHEGGIRNPLTGGARRFAGLGDGTPFDPHSPRAARDT